MCFCFLSSHLLSALLKEVRIVQPKWRRCMRVARFVHAQSHTQSTIKHSTQLTNYTLSKPTRRAHTTHQTAFEPADFRSKVLCEEREGRNGGRWRGQEI